MLVEWCDFFANGLQVNTMISFLNFGDCIIVIVSFFELGKVLLDVVKLCAIGHNCSLLR